MSPLFPIPPFTPSARQIPFAKFHGAGNDFILVDDPEAAFPDPDAAFIARLCARRTGIGADGLILLRPSTPDGAAAARMCFFNSDGSRAALCGNGLRCLAFFTYLQRRAPAAMRLQTDAGLLSAELLSLEPVSGAAGDAPPAVASVRVQLPPPADERLSLSLDFGDASFQLHHLDTGVPHAVHFLAPADPSVLAAFPLATFGPFVRHHALFAPAGANIDVCLPIPPSTLHIRTYERGVEAETLACGTGATAAACLAARLGLLDPTRPITVLPALGTPLVVTPPTAASPSPYLLGPAHLAYAATAPLRPPSASAPAL